MPGKFSSVKAGLATPVKSSQGVRVTTKLRREIQVKFVTEESASSPPHPHPGS